MIPSLNITLTNIDHYNIFDVRIVLDGSQCCHDLSAWCLQDAQMASHLRYLYIKVAPLTLIPQLFVGGVMFSLFDVARRIAVEEVLKKEEVDDLNKQLRKDEKFYDL